MALDDLTDSDKKVYEYLKLNDFVEKAWSTKKAATALKMKEDDVYEIELKRALELLSIPKLGRGGRMALRDLGIPKGEKENIHV